MNKTLSFFVAAPMLCGCKNHERWADVIKYVYEAELFKNDSVFAKNNIDRADPINRLEVGFAWDCRDNAKKEYCKLLATILMLSHYVNEHGEKEHNFYLEGLLAEAESKEVKYPDVAEYMTVAEAAKGFWTP